MQSVIKNQGLKVKIDEVTVNLFPRFGRPAEADRSSSAQMFVWGCMTNFQKISSKSTVSLSKIAFSGRKSHIADRKIADKLYGKSDENFQSPGFPHNFSKKLSPELKYGLYRRVSTSATICDKN